MIDVELTATVSFFSDRFLGLSFGSYEQDITTAFGYFTNEIVSSLKTFNGLLKVDDINTVSLRKDEWLHLWVPAPGLVTEVYSTFQKLFHTYYCHVNPSWIFLSFPSMNVCWERNRIKGIYPALPLPSIHVCDKGRRKV
jgi:predicted AlkP superfamily pyrophosphatase or phosphodiesterase